MLMADIVDMCTVVLIGVGGLALILVGLRGRRVGDEPRCRKCAHDLAEFASERCPKCGSVILSRGIAYGTVRRRWALLLGGVVPLLVSAWLLSGIAIAEFRMIDWYAHSSTSRLLADARNADGRAFQEVVRREKEARLSDTERSVFIEAALTTPMRTPPPANLSAWLEALNRWDAAGVLSPVQRARFYDQLGALVTPAFHGDAQVRCGGRWSWRLTHDNLRVFEVYHTNIRFTVNGAVLPVSRTRGFDLDPVDSYRGDAFALPEVELPPGQYQVQYVAEYTFHRPGERLRRACGGGGFASREVTASTDLEVLPPLNPGPIESVSSPELDEQVRAAIKLDHLDAVRRSFGPELVCVGLAFEPPLPVDIAFDIWLRGRDQEVRVGHVARSRDATAQTTRTCVNLEGYAEKDLCVVLRSSEAATRNSPGMVEIWGGELTLGPQRVRRTAVMGNPP